MGQMKNYILRVLEMSSEHAFGQDAVEWGIVTGRLKLCGILTEDLKTIFSVPAGEAGPDLLYDQLCEDWRAQCQKNATVLDASYKPILEELNRAVPLALAA